MKTQLTSVQLAILDSKQSRGRQLNTQEEALYQETLHLLELEDEVHGRAHDLVVDFLNGSFTPAQLAAKLSIEVTS